MSKRIIYQNETGGISVVIPTPEYLQTHTIEEVAAKDVPAGIPFEIVEDTDFPKDRIFRDAWEGQGKKVIENLAKAKLVAHAKRREARDKEFAPYDDIIAKQVPGQDAKAAEAERQKIRVKDAALQTKMDAAKTPDELRTLLPK